MSWAAIVLAAGTASRMGRLKQLLPYGAAGSLLQHAIQQVLEAEFAPVLVVTGAQAESVEQALAAEPVTVVRNATWQTGMGSSIVAGVKALNETVAGLLLLTGDQPLVTANHLREMRQALEHKTDVDALAAEYSGTLGIPAIFRARLFPQLRWLPAAHGAKHLLMDAHLKIARFPLPEAAADIDTPEDWERLLAQSR